MRQRIKRALEQNLPAPVYTTARRGYRDLVDRAQGNRRAGAAFANPTILTDDFGIRFICYPWETVGLRDLLSRKFYKPEFEAMKNLVKTNSVVFDVGANIGLHSAYLSRLLAGTGYIHAFEPVPKTFHMLRETLALNQIDNVVSNMMALGDKQATLEMQVFEDQFSAWNTFGHPKFDDAKPTATINVRTTTLDAYCDEHGVTDIQFLKIDVEGYELEVLEGAKQRLASGSIGSLS